jgi:transposase-like protein
MSGPQAPHIALSEEERQELLTLIRAHKTPQHFSFRAQIILHLADGSNTREVAHHLGTSRLTVRRWRRYWLERHACSVPERFQDAPRPGAPATFSIGSISSFLRPTGNLSIMGENHSEHPL